MVNLQTSEELQDEFRIFSITFQSDDVVDQMLTLCLKYQLDASSVVNEWMAYSSKSMGQSKAKEFVVTLDQVTQFEKMRLAKQPAQPLILSTPVAVRTPTEIRGSSFKTPSSFSRSIKIESNSGNHRNGGGGDELGLLGGKLNFDEQGWHIESDVKEALKPAVPFRERTNRGELVAALNCLPMGMDWHTLPKCASGLIIRPQDPSSYLSDPYPYMFVKFQDVALALNNNIDELAEEIALASDITQFSSPDIIGDKCYSLGRLLPSDGKDNSFDQYERLLKIQASSTLHNGIISLLDVGLVKQYSMFPGQIIAVNGQSTGRAFAATEVVLGAIPRETRIPTGCAGTLHVVVACGPYNVVGDEQPEALKELIKYIEETPPDVVILMGPFVDDKFAHNEKFLSESTFDEYFTTIMPFILEEIVERMRIHLIIIPSAGQLSGVPVYPVPRYELKDCVLNASVYTSSEFHSRMFFAPEPALLNIGGVIFGITSTDIISHLCKREFSFGMPDERLPRLAGHLLLQQSFYPLYPAEIAVDVAALHNYAKIRQKPHILITPSEFKGFAKNVHGTVCINPERLSKACAGGSFARIFVDLSPTEGQNDITSVTDRTTVEVVRI